MNDAGKVIVAQRTGFEADCLDDAFAGVDFGAPAKDKPRQVVCPVAFAPKGGAWPFDALVAAKTPIVRVDAQGAASVNGTAAAADQLADALGKAIPEGDGVTPRAILEIDAALTGALLQTILDACSAAGIEDLRFATAGKTSRSNRRRSATSSPRRGRAARAPACRWA